MPNADWHIAESGDESDSVSEASPRSSPEPAGDEAAAIEVGCFAAQWSRTC
jgi:hypothetical protein